MIETQAEKRLDEMLAQALSPPELPADFQAQVMAAVARDAAQDSAKRRLQLGHEHIQSVAQLRRQSVRECVEALVFAACVFFPITLAVHALTARPGSFTDLASPNITALLSLFAIAVAATAIWLPLKQARQP